MNEFRIEHDSIGTKEVPKNAYYGIQSLRAFENFRVNGRKAPVSFIKAIVEIKKAASITNEKAGVIDTAVANAMVKACDEILAGQFWDHFIVDAVQGGAGTSFNMNANEVIANRAIEILGGEKGDYSIVHPNDHVNCGQSTNDVFPSAGKIATIRMLKQAIEALNALHDSFIAKSREFNNVIKIGRTEMQDAVPISFGQCFRAYASALSRDVVRFQSAVTEMSRLNMGGTAIGTGITANAFYIKNIVPTLCQVTSLELVQADDLIDATQNLDGFVFVSGIIKSCATTLSKIANDLRLMSSGPRTGLSEINLPPKQNGSSIMPGKINPVIPELVNQIAFMVIGNDATITLAAEAGQLELNAFEPIVFVRLFESLEALTNGINIFRKDCIDGITVNLDRCQEEVEKSISIVTALCPHIGYAKASQLAKKALKDRKNIREILLEEKVVPEEDIHTILNPNEMI